MKKVKGHSFLYRNETGAIVNMDSEGYTKSKIKKISEENKSHKIKSMEEDIAETKQELKEIKELLLQFLNK
jgi:hypothetical protein